MSTPEKKAADRQMPATKSLNRVFAAIDTADPAEATLLAGRLAGAVGGIKVGKEYFTAAGPQGVRQVMKAAALPLFLDLKFHDIPNTVASACRVAAELGVWMVNVHTLGGARMMAAAREAVDKAPTPPLLIGVTILTSHDEDDLRGIGLPGSPEENVLRLAKLAQDSGLDGVVCSPLEAAGLRQARGPAFKLVTPGIRPASAAVNDQKRIMTPSDAVRSGADYLVIGRPITAAEDPVGVLLTINSELAAL